MLEDESSLGIPPGLVKIPNSEALNYYSQLQAQIDAKVAKYVPHIPNTEFKRLRQQIKPVLSFREVPTRTEISVSLVVNGEKHYYEPTSTHDPSRTLLYLTEKDPTRQSFLVDKKPVGIASDLNREEVLTMTTYHEGQMFFKPTVAEILAQIRDRVPQEALPLIRAYEINVIDCPPQVEIPGYLHATTTTLYTTTELLQQDIPSPSVFQVE